MLNPAGSGGTRFLLASVGLQTTSTAANDVITKREVEARDVVLAVLGAKHVEDLAEITNREKLKLELKAALDSLFGPGVVRTHLLPAVRDSVTDHGKRTTFPERYRCAARRRRQIRAAAARPVALEASAELYDFRRPRHVSKERLRTLEAMYERLVKSLEAWLIGRVRKQVELRLQSVEQFSFGEFTLSLPTPCASFGFDILNIEGQQGVIDVGHEFAYLLVDRFFGGGGQPASMHRALTPIERLAVRTVVERIGVLLAETWQDYVELQLDITTFESFPDMVQGIGRSDPVLVANIEVAIGSETSMLLLCLPLAVLDKFFSSAEQQRVQGNDRLRIGAARDAAAHRTLAARDTCRSRGPSPCVSDAAAQPARVSRRAACSRPGSRRTHRSNFTSAARLASPRAPAGSATRWRSACSTVPSAAMASTAVSR